MAQQLHKLAQKKKYRAWIILGKHKRTGEYMGITEHSFSMGTSTERIRVEPEWELLYFTKDKTKRQATTEAMNHLRKNVKTYSKRFPEYTFTIYRTGSKNCPVSINWGRYHTEKKEMINKFNRRNLIFKVK